MNNINKTYKKRLIDHVVETRLKIIGGLLIQGPKFVGKTTTARQFTKSEFIFQEDEKLKKIIEVTPDVIFQGEKPKLLDEWQIYPNIWSLARHEIDKIGLPGQFILSGSSTPPDIDKKHNAAGRFGILTLRTMSLQELSISMEKINFLDLFNKGFVPNAAGDIPFKQYAEIICKGGWPYMCNFNYEQAANEINDYLNLLITPKPKGIKNKPEFNKRKMLNLVKALSRNIGQQCKLEKIGCEAKIMKEKKGWNTMDRYLNILINQFIIEKLEAWKTHLRSAIQSKVSPKWYFIDPSIAASALSITPDKLMNDLNTFGFFFEALVIKELRIYADLIHGEVYFHQDNAGLEIDAIVELRDGRWSAFEVKLGGPTAIEKGINSLKSFAKKIDPKNLDSLISLNVITTGLASYQTKDGINVINLSHLYLKQE